MAVYTNKKVKIGVDDTRPVPLGYEGTKSVYETITLIEKIEADGGEVEILDLDHDLEDYEFLAEAMINGINTGYFDVVAHPDRIFRRCKDWTEICNHIAYEIGVSAARASMPLERNFSSMRRKKQYREEFWDRIQHSMLVVDGIDAHSINEIEDYVKQNEGW